MFENVFCRMMPKCRKVLSKSLHLRCGLSYSHFTCSNFWSPSSSWPLTISWGNTYSRFNFVKLTIYWVVSLCQVFIIFWESKVNFRRTPKNQPKKPAKKRRKNHQKKPAKKPANITKKSSPQDQQKQNQQGKKRPHTNLRY